MASSNNGTPEPSQEYWGNPKGSPEVPAQTGQVPPVQAIPMAQDLPEKRHVHHSYIWLGSLRATLQTLITVFIILFATMIGENMEGALRGSSNFALILGGILVGFFVLIMALIVVIYVLSYRHLFYELGPEEFNLYSGVFSKKRVHVPYQRVQSVNQRMSILQRLFGVCTLYIDTAGGSSNKAVVVPYVQNFEAERLRKEIFARKQMILSGKSGNEVPATGGQVATAVAGGAVATAAQGTNVLDAPAEFLKDVRGVFGAQEVDTGEVTYEYGITNKELVLTGLSNNMGFALMVLAVIGSVATALAQVLETAIGRALANEGAALVMRMASENLVGFIVGTVLVVIFVMWIVSVIGTCISYGGFHARRRQSRIEVEHGLLQHQFHGVDIDRVQSVIIKQGFIRRIFGYCQLSLGKIDAFSGESSEGQQAQNQTKGLVIHPFVKMSRVPEILAGLVPEFAEVPTETIGLPKRSLRRGLIRRCLWHGSGFWLAIVVAVPQILMNIFMGEGYVYENITDMLSFEPELFMINMVCLGIYAICVVILIFEIIGSVLWYRGSSFAYNNKFMQVTNGGFSRESISFPRKKIQFGTVRTNPFQRLSHVATVKATTAAGIGGTTMSLLDVDEKEAAVWLDWLLPRRNKQ